MNIDSSTSRVSNAGKPMIVAAVVGVIGLAISAAGFASADLQAQFAHSYLVSFLFWTSIGLGCLFFVLVHHLVNGRWMIVIRRIGESGALTLPVMFVMMLPLLGMLMTGKLSNLETGLWPWSNAEWMASDHVMHGKLPWLNPNFFVLRTCIYFGIWSILATLLWRNSLRQDVEGHSDKLYMRFRITSGPGMVLFALSITFASFDWLMSIQPKWFSTMFGVYMFSMSVLAMWCFLALAVTFIRSQGALKKEVSINHYHDLGKWMFAFTVFWAYIAFCQFLLIWYANLPEETEFYLERWLDPSWRTITFAIIFGHFVIPFLFLISRVPKRNVLAVCIAAVWILAMHWIELHWLVMASLHGFHLHWLDATTFIGVGGIFLATFWWRFTSAPVIPVKDPFLQQSIEFVNA